MLTIAVLGLLGVVLALTLLWISRAEPDQSMLDKVAEDAGLPLSEPRTAWLTVELRRRVRYRTAGLSIGLTLGWSVDVVLRLPDGTDVAVALVLGATGLVTGLVMAARRTFTMPADGYRSAVLVRRTTSDVLGSRRSAWVVAWLAAPVMGAVLSVAIITGGDPAHGWRALLLSSLASAVTLSVWGVMRTLVAAPMASSDPEDLAWRRALLTENLDLLPRSVYTFGAIGAVTGIWASATADPAPPAWVTFGLAGFAVAWAAAVLLRTRVSLQIRPSTRAGSR